MKKIILLIESLGPGGAERQLSGLAVMLKEKDFEVEVWYYCDKRFFVPFLNEHGVKSVFLTNGVNEVGRFFALRRAVKQAQPDAVISYSASSSMVMCVLRCFSKHYRLIVSERNTTQFLGRMEKLRFWLYRFADAIVPNSYSQTRFIDSHYSQYVGKLHTITNFVDLDRFSPDENRIERQRNIICVGRLMAQKNILRFIDAVNIVKQHGCNVHVDWYGKDRNDEYSSACHHKIAEYGLSEEFVFHDPIVTIEDEYRKASVFCLPSIYEGFPNVLCEAMSCGLPVMASRICDNPSIVRENVNGCLFDPADVNEMASVIERMNDMSETELTKWGHSSRRIAQESFSSDSFIQQYISLLSH